MATYEDLMGGARKADAAGDARSAKRFLELAAEAKRSAVPSAPAAPAQSAPQGGGLMDGLNRIGNAVWDQGMAPIKAMGNLGQAAEGIVNDMSAGMQRVNPVGLAEKRGNAVGVLKDGYVDVDGTREPLENYPEDKFVTAQEGGQTYIYPRTPDIAASRLESAGRLLGYGVPHMPEAAIRPPVAKAGAQAAKEAADLGITPSFAMRGTASGKIAAAGEQFAPTASRFRQDAQRVTGEMQDAAFKLADRAGPGATPFEGGSAIQRGGESFVSAVKDRRSQLYGLVDKAMPPKSGLQAPETLAVLAKEGDKLRKLPNTISPDRLEALQSGAMTWEQARALRTDIGTALRSFDGSETNVAKGQLDQIYKALSTDLDKAVQAAGPEAQRVWKRANDYTRASQQRIDTAFGKVLGDKVAPEQAYDRLIGMAQEGGARANIASLNEMFRSLPKEDAAVVAGTVIRRMGRATNSAQNADGDAWSAATFLTNWNKMAAPARKIISRSGLDPGVDEELTKLARVAEKAKEAGTFRNHSNTGNAATGASMGTAFLYSLITGHPLAALGVAGTAGAAHLSARALTNVGFLRALNEAASKGQKGGLLRIARGKGPLAIEAQTILRLPAPEASSPQSQPTVVEPATY